MVTCWRSISNLSRKSPNHASGNTVTVKRLVLVVAAILGALALVIPVSFVLVIVLAGPHAGLLPQPLEVAVLIMGWLAVLVVPAIAARAVWKKTERS